MTRPRSEIMRDLKAILAELDYAMHGEDSTAGVGTNDLSPKLAQALKRETMPTTTEVPLKTHEEIRQQARDYTERPRDYLPADYEGFDEAVFLGTGDRNEP